MKFNELISKDMCGEIDVYLASRDNLDTKIKLFDTFFDLDDEEKWVEYKSNLRKYWDYDVYWFKPQHYMRESGVIVVYLRIIIEEPRKEELPF